MSTKLVWDYCADIYKFPTKLHDNAHIKELTLGDLHANSMLLMYFLVSHKVCSIKPADYKLLKSIYIKKVTQLTKSDLLTFNRIIANLKINTPSPLIRLIGDEICDRGQNDYFILKILNKLKESQVKIEIIFSNHGSEFLIPFELKQPLHAPNINVHEQAESLNNMNVLLEKGIIDRAEVDQLVEETYLPNLKLISYSVHQNDLTIFSHAAIGLETIDSLALYLDIPGGFKDKNIEELTQTMDAINNKFSQLVKASKVHELLKNTGDTTNPVIKTIWNRNYENLHRPVTHNNYNLFFAHGHDSNDPNPYNIFNLDHHLGKYLHCNLGNLPILQTEHQAILNPSHVTRGPTLPKNMKLAPAHIKESSSNKFIQDVLTPLNNKIADLKKRKISKALKEKNIQSLEQLKLQLIKHWSNYINEHSIYSQAYEHFKTNCQSDLDVAQKELGHHRGWSEFLINLFLAITVVGILIKGVINKINHKPFFFVHKTESQKILERIEERINEAPESDNSFCIRM